MLHRQEKAVGTTAGQCCRPRPHAWVVTATSTLLGSKG